MAPDVNPYESPHWPGNPSARRPEASVGVQIVVGVVLVAGCTVLFAAVGGLVAAALDRFAPGYYPGVFPGTARGGYSASVGMGTGILQGLLLGLLVGGVVTAGLRWFKQLQLANGLRALLFVAAFALGFGAAGMLIGYGMGVLAPDYYRGLFHSYGRQADFSPSDVGIGLGCTEGLMLGAAVGTLVVVALAWRRSRQTTAPSPP
jgi:hypothetical protein